MGRTVSISIRIMRTGSIEGRPGVRKARQHLHYADSVNWA
jgi:hypothetical protein